MLKVRVYLDTLNFWFPCFFGNDLTLFSSKFRQLSYQTKKESPEIAQLLLASVCSEPCSSLRLEILSNLKISSIPGIVSLLHTLLHDFDINVRREVLKSLTLLLSDPKVELLLKQFLLEKITDQRSISNEDVRCFLNVSQTLTR